MGTIDATNFCLENQDAKHRTAPHYSRTFAAKYAAAQGNLGNLYSHGQGVVQDYAEAERWYRKAAGQGNAAAQFNLGLKYDIGQGAVPDYAEAERWYHKAADQDLRRLSSTSATCIHTARESRRIIRRLSAGIAKPLIRGMLPRRTTSE